MSPTNAKDSTPKAKADAAAQKAPGTSNDMAPAVVQPAKAAKAPDEHHGQGGLYTMKGGKRVLVEKTQTTPPTTKEPQ